MSAIDELDPEVKAVCSELRRLFDQLAAAKVTLDFDELFPRPVCLVDIDHAASSLARTYYKRSAAYFELRAALQRKLAEAGRRVS